MTVRINLICGTCKQRIKLSTSNFKKTEDKIGTIKCPKCKTGKLKKISK